ncbi:chemotaxis protein CheA, partial [Pseudomonas sp. SIMBA_059]
AAVAPVSTAPAATASDAISEHEFEALLDQLHGKGKFSGDAVAVEAPVAAKVESKPVAKPAPAPVSKPAPAPRAPAPAAEKHAVSEAETTVRVDTARLDEIMNMVGQLVL